MSDFEREQTGDTELAPARPKITPPRKYSVMLINDDFTPMDFVVDILNQVFRLDDASAVAVMLAVHEKGRGIAGTYTREVAETKIAITHGLAQQSGHPLRCELAPV